MGIVILFSCQTGKNNKETTKPNVILFLVDDLGWTDVTTFGSDFHQTPHVDQLAASGISFTNAYAACTVCSPTRASLMTGKYPARINCTDWITGHNKPYAKMKIPDWTQYVAEEEYTLAEALKDNGYITAHFGKWHLGEAENYWPERQGFDYNFGGWSAGSPALHNGGGYFSPYNNPRLADGPEGEYLTKRLAREVSSFITQYKDSSFFINFWLYNVHTPLEAEKDKIDKYKTLLNEDNNHTNPVYAAMVEHMDDALGKVIQTLKDQGIYDNTIIIFFSDNGGYRRSFGNREKVTSNFPLRSGKGDMFEGGVRVPLIIHWPEKFSGGKVKHDPVISMDVYSTILGLTGSSIDTRYNSGLDGVDLTGILMHDDAISRKSLYWHYPHYHREGAKPYSAVRMGDWKLIEVFEYDSLQLFNLKEDIREQYNLASSHPEKVEELYQELNNWRIEVGAQMPTRNPNYDPEKEETWIWGSH
jgi:arylsulfatase A-like enzyme